MFEREKGRNKYTSRTAPVPSLSRPGCPPGPPRWSGPAQDPPPPHPCAIITSVSPSGRCWRV